MTNSSSDSAIIIIALRKGKCLEEIMRNIGIPAHLPEDFDAFGEDDLGYTDGIEIDHLIDEYDILVNEIFTAQWGDSNYEMPDEEFDAISRMVSDLEEKGGKNLLVLKFSETTM